MAELLSHVLLAFAVFTVVGWAVDWLDRRWVGVGMVGSVLPDLNRLDILLDDSLIEQATGVPFNWDGIQTLGGLLLLAAVGALLFEQRVQQRRAFGLLVAGGCSHLVIDSVKLWADGAGGVSLYPFSWWRNPTPGLYVSSDLWMVLLSFVVATLVWLADYLVSS